MDNSIKNIKSQGSAQNGFHHWWLQRLTAIFLIPLAIWFVVKLTAVLASPDDSVRFFSSGFSVIFFSLILLTALFHSTLGVKVVIEDYVHKECTKFFLLIFINLFAWLTGALLIFSLVNLYVSLV